MIPQESSGTRSYPEENSGSTNDSYNPVPKEIRAEIGRQSTRAVISSNKKFTSELQAVRKEIEELDSEVRGKIEDLSEKQVDQIQTLSIFVAFFTFVSVEFGILRGVTEPILISAFTLILLGSLAFFVTLIDVVLNHERKTSGKIRLKFILLMLMSIFLIVIGLLVTWKFEVNSTVYDSGNAEQVINISQSNYSTSTPNLSTSTTENNEQ